MCNDLDITGLFRDLNGSQRCGLVKKNNHKLNISGRFQAWFLVVQRTAHKIMFLSMKRLLLMNGRNVCIHHQTLIRAEANAERLSGAPSVY